MSEVMTVKELIMLLMDNYDCDEAAGNCFYSNPDSNDVVFVGANEFPLKRAERDD